MREKVLLLQTQNDSLNKKVDLLEPFRAISNHELVEKDDTIASLESRISSMTTMHREEINSLKSKLFQKESQLKEYIVDDD